MKKLLIVVLAILALTLALAGFLWWKAMRGHHALGSTQDYAELSALRYMPEGETGALSFYGLSTALPSAATVNQLYAVLQKGGTETSPAELAQRYEALREILSGETTVAFYQDEARPDVPARFVAALRPRPASVFKAVYMSAGMLVSGGGGTEPYELNENTRLYVRRGPRGIFVSNDEAMLDRIPSGPRPADSDGGAMWARLEKDAAQGGALSGVGYLVLPLGKGWGVMHRRGESVAWDGIVQLTEEERQEMGKAVELPIAPGSYEGAALEFWHRMPAEKEDQWVEQGAPDVTRTLTSTLRALYVLPPTADGDGALPSLVLGFTAGTPEQVQEIKQAFQFAMAMISLSAQQQMGGFFHPEPRDRSEGRFSGSEIPLGIASPCWMSDGRFVLASTECGVLKPLMGSEKNPVLNPSGKTAEGERARLVLRGKAMADTLEGLQGLGQLAGKDFSMDPKELALLARLKEIRLSVREPDAQGYLPMRLEASWAP